MGFKKPSLATRRHAYFMTQTLAPDLAASGRTETAKDVARCGRLMAKGKKSAHFATFLTKTLIPDLRASGSRETAKDLAKCARAIAPKRPTRRRRRRSR
jgi:hypothetical protein